MAKLAITRPFSCKVEGALNSIPQSRSYDIYFVGIKDGAELIVTIDGNPVDFKTQYRPETCTLQVMVDETPVKSEIQSDVKIS